ncbi:MAG: restriction endonuclease [Oscillospiraceae bacterium]|nr:MAG: restriction endonuclease [Oscillospiraceae bacterium]
MDKHSFPNGKRLVRDTLKPDDNLHYEQFQDGTINEYENELPFEIPSKWVWCNLGMLFSHNTGKALNASKTDGASLTYITTSNVYWNSFELGNLKIMPFTDSEIEKCTVKKGDLLVCEGGDIGRAAIWQFENEIRIQNHLHRLRPYDRIYTKFYYYIMYLYKANGRINGNGIGLQGLSSNALHNIIVPVPPVEEQKRIVDSIDSVLSLIEQIESHKQNLSSQIDNIKSKILDLAIRGKLVPQDPNDEPASVLLERIRAEKEELIKQGKIKRDKKESVIFKGDDNSYYEKYGEKLPSGWVVTNFETLLSYEQPTNYIVKDTNYNSEYETPVLTAGKSFILGYTNEKENIFSELPVIIFDDFTTESKFVDFPFKVKSSAMKILHINTDLVLPKFAFYLMQATQIDHDNHQRYWISTYSQEEIALPPLKEQERILSVLEQYFKLLNCLL